MTETNTAQPADADDAPTEPEIRTPALAAAPDLDDAVQFLNRALCESGVRLAVTVSDYVVTQFFGGNAALLGSHDKTKTASYNALCERPDLAMGHATLRRLVRVGLQVRQLPQEVAAELDQSQHRALLTVHDSARKTELARAAVAGHWTAAEIRQAIATNPADKRGGGRKAKPPVIKALAALQRAVASLGEADAVAAALVALPAADRAAATAMLDQQIGRLTALRQGAKVEQ